MSLLNQIRAFVLNNWMAKVFCLLLAVSLWGWVKIQQIAEVQVDVPVKYRNLPEEFVVTEESDRNVKVTLSGPKTALNRVEPSNVAVEIDGGQLEQGENSVRILPWNLDYPRGVEVESIQPPRITVVIERRIRKRVQVDPNFSEPPPEGFNYSVSVEPDSAVVFGSAEILNSLSEIDLEAVDLSEHDTGFVKSDARARLPDGVSLEQPAENRFTIDVNIFEPTVTRTIEGLTVEVLNVPPGKVGVVEPAQISLEVEGLKGAVDSLRPSDIQVEARAPEDKSSTLRQARVKLPESVKLAGGQPDRRTVRVILKDQE